VFAFRYFFVSYFGVTVMLIPWLWFRFGDWSLLAYAFAVNAFFWIASIPELKTYATLRRAGEFDKGRLFTHVDGDRARPLARFVRRRGWMR
jgi:hypothetical protein